jgi:GTP pyrophosphokinase
MSEQPTSPLSGRFTEAVEYAVAAHRSQRRKGSDIPYVAHVLAVSSLVLEMESSEDEAIAGLLHDVIEDVGADQDAVIEARFGHDVVAIVRANSDTDEIPKPPWLARKEDYIAGIATKSPPALRVSIADKLHNARSILDDHRRYGNAIFDRFNSLGEGRFATRRDGVLWYYESLVKAFERRREGLGPGGAAKLADLAQTVAAMRSATSG